MEPAKFTLSERSQVKLTNVGLPRPYFGLTVEGADLVAAYWRGRIDAEHGDPWPTGEKLSVVLEPHEPGEMVIVAANSSAPEDESPTVLPSSDPPPSLPSDPSDSGYSSSPPPSLDGWGE